MPVDWETIRNCKAMAYDLTQVFEAQPDKTYTVEEIKQILAAYIKGQEK